MAGEFYVSESARLPRKLAAILYADVAGYSRLTGEDEDATHRHLSEYLDVISSTVEGHRGRVMHYAGDAVLAMFEAVVDALSCAAHIQRELETRNEGLPDERKVQFRIGVNLGDVIEDRGDIYGDGVNIAARLESLARPGGICISEFVHATVGDKLPLDYDYIGEQQVKNIAKPIRAYQARLKSDAELPVSQAVPKGASKAGRRIAISVAIALVVAVAGSFAWLRPWEPKEEPASVERMAFPLPDKPSIAVLAFTNMSGDAEQEYLSDGLSENIITELSRFRELFVIARHSSFSYKGKPVTIQQVSKELGVRYVVEGSLQRADDRVRVTVQLIDASGGKHQWGERYDRRLTDVFSIQDKIVRTVVASIAEEVQMAEGERALREHPNNLQAFEYVLRGRKLLRMIDKEATEQARQMYENARKIDPRYAEAYEGLAKVYNYAYRWRFLESVSRETAVRIGCEMAQKAVALEPFWYRGHWVLANCHMFRRELDQSLAEYERALELNPNSSEVRAAVGEPLVYLGRAKEAIAGYKAAIRLNPHHPDWFLWQMGWAQYLAEQYENALSTINRMNKMPNAARRTLAPILVHLGRIEEARKVIAKYLEKNPDYTLKDLSAFPFRHKEYLERWTGDLRAAGMPE